MTRSDCMFIEINIQKVINLTILTFFYDYMICTNYYNNNNITQVTRDLNRLRENIFPIFFGEFWSSVTVLKQFLVE